MGKDFQKWHTLKSEVEAEHKLFERPVLVFRKFNKELFLGLPMTSKKKEGKYYNAIHLHGIERSAILSQIRVLSGKRLIRRLGKLSDKQFSALENAFIFLIKETDPVRGPQVPNGNL